MTVATTLRRLDAELGELLARHERGRSPDEFAAYSNDPIGFKPTVRRAGPSPPPPVRARLVRLASGLEGASGHGA
jgi:hypothetical protein